MMKRTNLIRQHKTIKTEKRSIIKYVLLGFGGIFAISSVIMTVETASSGVEVASLREKQSELEAEKRNLENILVKSLSLSDLEEKSVQLGYVEPSDTIYVSGSKETVAQLP